MPLDPDPQSFAASLARDIAALPLHNTPTIRKIRRAASKLLKDQSPAFVMQVAMDILASGEHRWVAYELVHEHEGAFRSLAEAQVEELGRGINSWWTVDSFGATISGPTWQAGQVSDALIQRWAESPDRWWRRAALVSTVPLNIKARGGVGDTRRTLAICRLLVDDRDDMVVKALSWALRALVSHDPQAVRAFLSQHEEALAARVLREVNNKLETGLKNPGKTKPPL